MKKGLASALSFLFGLSAGGLLVMNWENKLFSQKHEFGVKFWMMYQMMEKWMRLKLNGETLADYFHAAGYQKIAVYGMGDIGRLLVRELSESDIHVAYGIDKNKDIKADISVYEPAPGLEPVDAVVVTAIAYYDEIAAMLTTILDCPVLSMENVVVAQLSQS